MTHRIATATSVLALVCAGAASADVTAQEVWDTWADSLALYGDSAVTYDDPVMDGDTLVVGNVRMDMSETDGSVLGELGEIRLTENGDGTVSITMAEEMRFSFSPGAEITDADRADLVMRNQGLVTTVSGDPDAMVFDFSADRQEVVLESITSEGQPVDGQARFALNGASGSYGVETGESVTYVGDLAAASVEILVDFDVPEEQSVVFLSGRMDELAMTFDVSVPEGFDSSAPPEEMATLFQDGLDVAVGYSTGAVSYMFDVTDGSAPASGTATAGSTETSIAVDFEAGSYSSRVTDVAVNVESSEMPFPIELGLAEYGIGIDVPLSSTEDPADFSASINLTDLAVNDMIWMMVDPQGQLGHDPATLIIDISGTVRWLFDLLDPAQAEALAAAAMPAEVHSLNLDDLRVLIAGGELTGAGAFTFDNTDLITFGGVPRPEGQLSLKLTGGNALLDGLVAMGLIGESEAMQARMMTGMFTNSTGDDQLESTVEINAEGHVMVNGQRIQ